ncbi:tail fiber assembly protein [Citrobacter freundii]|nr:tail fiber assembly protein [Citrobacter freundii]
MSKHNDFIVPPVAGKPSWVDVPPLTRAEVIAIAENERKRLIVNADAIMIDWRTELMLGEISDANRAKLSAWLAYKNKVKSIPAEEAITAEFSWPDQPA